MSEAVLHVFTDDVEWVIAADAADARKVYEEYSGAPDLDGLDWDLCDDGKLFTFFDGNDSIVKTFGEWATEKGRGYFASENY
jgi:hypothetical protein